MHLLLVMGLVGTNGTQGEVKGLKAEARLVAPSEWVVEWAEIDGERVEGVGEERFDAGKTGLKLDREGHGVLDFMPGLYFDLDYRLDPAARQPRIDLCLRAVTLRRGMELTGTRALGIYRIDCIDRDRLMLCIGDGKKRPTEFATKPKDGCMLLVFKRKK
jgi:hypothetical protein